MRPDPLPGDGALARLRLLALARSDQPWLATILHAVRIVTAALIVTNGAAGAVAGILAGATGAGVGVAIAATGAMAGVLVRGDERFSRHATVVGVLLAGLSLGLLTTGPADPVQWWPLRFVLGGTMFAVVAGRTWHRGMLVGLLLAFHTAARLAGTTPLTVDDVRALAVELGTIAFNAALMLFVLESLLRAGRLTDRAREDAARESDRAAAARARASVAGEVERFIHDEVLHALRTIAMDRRDVAAPAAGSAAARLARLLDGGPVPLPTRDDLAERVRTAAATLPLRVHVDGDGAVVVPDDVGAALVSATLEALRNVHRHAGTDRATVEVRRSPGGATVRITDDGVGFDIGAVEVRWGLVSSVHQRMWDVGGDVDIESRPGSGTVVTLTWSAGRRPPGPLRRDGAGLGTLLDVSRTAAWVMLPYVGLALWNAAWLSPLLAAPWAGWAALLLVGVAAAAGMASVRRGPDDGAPRRWGAVPLMLVALAATALNGWALPEGTGAPSLYWAGQSALVVLVPLTLVHRPPLILLTGTGIAATILAFSLVAGADALTFLPVVAVPAVSALGYWAVRMILDGLAREARRTEEESARFRAAALARAEFAAELGGRMQQRRQNVADFVRAVAEGRLDPADPGVRARADALERAARDQMLPDVAVDLGRVAALLRDAGHAATLRLVADVPSGVLELAARALGLVIAAGTREEPLDVTLTVVRAGEQWRTGLLVTGPGRRTRDRLLEYLGASWTASSDPDSLHLTTTTAVDPQNR